MHISLSAVGASRAGLAFSILRSCGRHGPGTDFIKKEFVGMSIEIAFSGCAGP